MAVLGRLGERPRTHQREIHTNKKIKSGCRKIAIWKMKLLQAVWSPALENNAGYGLRKELSGHNLSRKYELFCNCICILTTIHSSDQTPIYRNHAQCIKMWRTYLEECTNREHMWPVHIHKGVSYTYEFLPSSDIIMLFSSGPAAYPITPL